MFSVRVEAEPGEYDELVTAHCRSTAQRVLSKGEGYVDAFFEDESDSSVFRRPPENLRRIDWVRRTEDAWPPLLRSANDALWSRRGGRKRRPPAEFVWRSILDSNARTGQHPCTRLCLEAMEAMRFARAIRCSTSAANSGILSIAAKLLGAAPVIAADNGPESNTVDIPMQRSETWTRCDQARSTFRWRRYQ